MKKFLFILFFLSSVVFAQSIFTGKWDVTSKTLRAKTIEFIASDYLRIIYKDESEATFKYYYNEKAGLIFIAELGYYYKANKNTIILKEAFGENPIDGTIILTPAAKK